MILIQILKKVKIIQIITKMLTVKNNWKKGSPNKIVIKILIFTKMINNQNKSRRKTIKLIIKKDKNKIMILNINKIQILTIIIVILNQAKVQKKKINKKKNKKIIKKIIIKIMIINNK